MSHNHLRDDWYNSRNKPLPSFGDTPCYYCVPATLAMQAVNREEMLQQLQGTCAWCIHTEEGRDNIERAGKLRG